MLRQEYITTETQRSQSIEKVILKVCLSGLCVSTNSEPEAPANESEAFLLTIGGPALAFLFSFCLP